MSTDPSTALLDDLRWLRALARRLTRDPDLAEDLVQDTCAVALTNGAAVQHPRGWLATVMRSLLLGRHRGDRRRERHYIGHQLQRPLQQAPDTSELVVRTEAQRRLAAMVLDLEEPYRSVILLRFFEGLPPRRIASHCSRPLATVNSQLQRALHLLRQRLDGAFGGRANWQCALAPLSAPTLLSPTLTLTLMNSKVKLFAAAVAAVACSAPFWWPAPPSDAALLAGSGQRAGRSSGDSGGSAGRTGTGSGPAPASSRIAASGEVAPDPEPRRFTVRGRVLGPDGRGVPAVAIGPVGAADLAVPSDGNGGFALMLATDAAALTVHDERFVAVADGDWSAASTIDPLVVVAPALRLGGRIVDVHRAPVAGAFVSLQLPEDFDARFTAPLERTGRARWHVDSGTDGTFRLGRLPAIEGARLLCAGPALAPLAVPLPPHDDENMEIVLERFAFGEGELRGRVVDAGGSNVAGAWVVMGVTSATTAADGTFAISLRRAGWPTAIVAAKAGHLPGRVDVPRGGGTKVDEWPAEIVVRLGPPPQSVRGRVVDDGGRPIAGAEVWIADPTPFGVAGRLPLQVEFLIGGGEVPRGGLQIPPNADDPTADGNQAISAQNVDEPTACWQFATTDGDGQFTLPGLLDRAYELKALDPATGRFGGASGVMGGGSAEIVIAGRHVWPELRGRVVSMRGRPIGGVTIQQNLRPFRAEARVPGGRYTGIVLRAARKAVSADDGTFVLHDVAHENCVFDLSGDTILPATINASAVADPLACRFEVEVRCHAEVVLQDPMEAEQVSCVDIDGEQVDLAVLRRNSASYNSHLPLHGGRSGLFAVSERGVTLHLHRGEQIVRSIAIQPDPARPLTVQ